MVEKCAIALAMMMVVSACSEDEQTEAPSNVDNPPSETQAAEEVAEPPAEESEATGADSEETVAVEPPAEGETTTLLSLREGFAENPSEWEGKTVTVSGLFLSATSAGGELNNISVIVSEEDYAEDRMAHSMMCAFGDDAPESVDLTQHDPVTVRGTVIERFNRAGLENCEIVE